MSSVPRRGASRRTRGATALVLAALLLTACTPSGGGLPTSSSVGPPASTSPSPPAEPRRTIRYMPLGDSITDGYGVPGAYRTVLWQRLVRDDHDRIDFVGSRSGGPAALGDRDHEGHVGWCIDGTCKGHPDDVVLPRIDRWMLTYEPDIVSIHLGTNDVGRGASGATTAERLDELVGHIYDANPAARVVLVQIVPMGVYRVQHDAYDALIPDVARTYQRQGRRISVVDMSHLLEVPGDYRDALHPTQAGYDRMGEALYPAVSAAYRTFT